MLRKKGIVRKTFLFSSLLIVLVILLSFSVLYFVMPGYYLRQKERTLAQNLHALTAALKTAETQEACVSLISGFVEQNNAEIMSFSPENMLQPEMSSPFVSMQGDRERNGFYAIFQERGNGDENGHVVITTRPERRDGIVSEPAGGNRPPGSLYLRYELFAGPEDAAKTRMQVLPMQRAGALSLREEVGNGLVGYVVAVSTLQPIDEAKGVILSLIPYVLLGAVAVGLVLAWVYARQLSKPILEISKAAVKMRDMDPEAACAIQTDDELGQLSGNLNDLYAKLLQNIGDLKAEMEQVNRLERSKTEMMQGASHELKTPVAALSGMLDGMIDNIGAYKNRDKYLVECRGQVEKLSLLVWEILDASKADHPAQALLEEETAVELLVEQELEACAAIAEERSLRVLRNLLPHTITTDPAVLRRALANLLSNAVRYTPEGGEIRIVLAGGELSIENKCEPIPEEELEKLFEPFYTRSVSRDRAQSGTGLGLYIVKRNLERLRIPYSISNAEGGIKISLALR